MSSSVWCSARTQKRFVTTEKRPVLTQLSICFWPLSSYARRGTENAYRGPRSTVHQAQRAHWYPPTLPKPYIITLPRPNVTLRPAYSLRPVLTQLFCGTILRHPYAAFSTDTTPSPHSDIAPDVLVQYSHGCPTDLQYDVRYSLSSRYALSGTDVRTVGACERSLSGNGYHFAGTASRH